jgi:hypothetical protein
MPRNSYFYYDHEACTFVEVQPNPLKSALRIGMWLGFAIILAGAGTWFLYETTTTPKEIALKEENRVLQSQMASTSQRFADLEGRLQGLAERDRDLYRTIFQAEPIPEGRPPGRVGGAAEDRFDRFSASTARLLRENAENSSGSSAWPGCSARATKSSSRWPASAPRPSPRCPPSCRSRGRSPAGSACAATRSCASIGCTTAWTSRSRSVPPSMPRVMASSSRSG